MQSARVPVRLSSVLLVLLIAASPASGASLVVTTADDSGPGSLRDALQQADGDGVPTEITFDSSLAGATIYVQSQLPVLQEGGTTLDGDIDGDCVPDVAISGELGGTHGLEVYSSDNVVRGLAIHSFPWVGIRMNGDVSGNVIECNHIGTDLGGSASLGNGFNGIDIGNGAGDNQIGPGNVIAFNTGAGVNVHEGGGGDAYPEFVGLTPDATLVVPEIDLTDDCYALRLADGSMPLDGNGDPFTSHFGIRLSGELTVGATGVYTLELEDLEFLAEVKIDGVLALDGPCCGPVSGTWSLDAGTHGIEIAFMDGGGGARLKFNVYGPGSAELTTGGLPGLLGEIFWLRRPAERNRITQNSIFDNTDRGIELEQCGGSENDPGDIDVGANTLLNFPEWTSYEDLGGDAFELVGIAPPEATVEIFAAAPDEWGGEGAEYLDSVMADLNGDFSGIITLPAGYLSVTATATDANGNTSEFARSLGLVPNEILVDNTAPSGAGSLPDAIDQANSDGVLTLITFDPALLGQPIVLDDGVHLSEDGTTIDGDFNGDCWPDVEISGTGNAWNGLRVSSSDNSIRGLVIHGFPGAGIEITDAGSRNVVECNFIGTDETGGFAIGNGDGIVLTIDGTDNRIGGPWPASRNVISGNPGVGIRVQAGMSGTVIEGNLIGTDVTGTAPLGNGYEGIILAGVEDSTVGPDNVIAYNHAGVALAEFLATDWWDFASHVPGYVGVFPLIDFSAADQCSALENADGIVPNDGGVGYVENFSARFSGTVHAPTAGDYTFELTDVNNGIGLQVDGAHILNDCCGTRTTTHYLEAGDHTLEFHYYVLGGPASLQLDVREPAGQDAALSTDGNVGGCAWGQSGLCGEFHHRAENSLFNTVTRNSIFASTWGLGIDLATCGQWGSVSPNDPGDGDEGPNTLLNFPELTDFAELGGDDYQVTGTAPADSTVELFAADPNESGYGEGREYLGTVMADQSGDFSAAVTLPSSYFAITATATDEDGNTSEFSANLTVRPNEITVTNTDTSGPGSLADAIDAANSDGTATVITFAGLQAGSTIELDDTLYIYDDNTTIDGDLDGDCVPDVEIRGNNLDWAHGLSLSSSRNVIRGLAINGFGNGIDLTRSNDNVVECNWIGLDLAGQPAGNFGNGIQVQASGNRIGPANVVAHNGNSAVALWEDHIHTSLEFPGLTPDASGVFPSIAFTDEGLWPFGGCGSYLRHVDGDPILDGQGRPFWDRIGGRFTATLSVDVPGDHEFVLDVRDNGLLKVDGTTLLDVGCCDVYTSVHYLDAGDHDLELAFTDGGMAYVQLDVNGPGNATLTAPGGAPGVFAELFKLRVPSEGNTITQNSFYANQWLGIQFGFCGIVPNDPGDLDDGINTLLNYPVFTEWSELAGDEFSIAGTAPPDSTVELFAASPNQNGFGDGSVYLGSLTADFKGDFTGTVLLPPGHNALTATATDGDGNTSQFAENVGLRPNEITVTNTASNGPGSLEDALGQASNDSGPTTITFDPVLAGQTIGLTGQLPAIFEDETVIDGDLDGDCIPDISVSGALAGGGLSIESSNNVIRGLRFIDFHWAIGIHGTHGNVVECNEVLRSEGQGISVQQAASDNRIGPGNVIAENGWVGIEVADGSLDAFPEFDGLVPDATDLFDRIDFTDDCDAFRHADGAPLVDGNGNPFTEYFGARFTATLTVDAPGDYELFVANPDDRVRISIDDQIVLDEVGCCDDVSATVTLDTGPHAFELAYFEDGGHAHVSLEIRGQSTASLSYGGQPGVLGELFQARIPSERNTITQNSIFDNGWMGIYLGGCGAIPNDPDDADVGANTWLNHPVFGGFTDLGGDSFEVSGTAPPNSTVELFAAAVNGSGYAEGKEYLGSATADPNGAFVTTISLPAEYLSITATATDSDGNTSEFSPNLGIRPNEITVETTDTYGPGSLADAIDQANTDGAPTVITFDGLPAGSTIELDQTLYIYDDNTTIDGDLDGDCWPDIELSGESTNGWHAIQVQSSTNVIRGLVINRFPGVGINISGWEEQPATGNVVECNFIGTDSSGTLAMGNESGVYLDGTGVFGNRIGGPAAASRNLLSGNYDAGVYIWADGNIVEGNLIGTDITGTQPLGNANEPVVIEGASGNRIGPDNVIAFNGRSVGVADILDWRYPDFDGLTAGASGVFETIDFSGECSPFENAEGFVPTDEGGSPFIQNFGALFTGTLDVSGGEYTFELLDVDDLISVTVDGETVMEEWCCGSYESSLFIDAGSHHLEVAYLQFDSNARLAFDVTGPGTISLNTNGNTGGCSEGLDGLCGEFFQLRLAAERNTITTNSIFDNQGSGIYLPGCYGENVPNDPGDADTGPNGFMNFPELVSALADAGGTVVTGSLDTPSAELATIELFANEVADPSGFGEGQTFLASLQPDTLGAFSVNLPEVPVGQWITATATDQFGNTSEFSAALRVGEIVRWATALYASPQSSTSVHLTWIEPSHDETGFRVERSLDGEAWVEIATAGPDDTGYLDDTLAPATLYYYQVIVFDAGGDLRPSNRAAATTFPAVAAEVCHQQVSTTHSGAALPSPAWNGESWAVAWQERRDGLYGEIYFQLLDPNGAPTGTPVRITETDAISQIPTLRWSGTSFALIYSEHMRGPDGEFWSIQKFARLDANGQPIVKDVLLNPGMLTYLSNQFDETLVWDGTHWGWFVSQDFDHPSPGPSRGDVAFYRLTEDGEIVLGPVRLTDTPEQEIEISAAWSGNEYGLTWTDRDAIFFRRLEADGTTLGDPVTLAGPGLSSVRGASTVWDGGGWAVAWGEVQPDGSEAILLRRLDAAGVPLGDAARISDDYDVDFGPGIPVYDENPQIVVRLGGGYAIYNMSYLWGAWSYELTRVDADAAGQRVGQRTIYTDADGRHSIWNRVATNGTDHLLTFNESRSGSQEIAAVVVGDAGAVVSGPAEITSGHDPGAHATYPRGAGNSWVVPVEGGFAALWDDPITGVRKIHASVYDGGGVPLAEDVVLTPAEVSSAPVATGVGNTFAVAWQDAATGQIHFDRFDASGTSLLGGVALDGYDSPTDLDFTGEAYGVVWSEGGGVRIQHVLPDGTLAGAPIALDGGGSWPLRAEWVGAGWAVVARAWPDLYYTLLGVDGEQLVPPTPVTTAASDRVRWVDLEWNGEHLGVTWEADGDWNREIWFGVLAPDGTAAFPEINLWTDSRWPSLYWQEGAFRVVFPARRLVPGGNREIAIQPDGTLAGERLLSAHWGWGHVAGNGATAGFAYTHRAEAYFETLACLEDSTAASAPSLSGWFDGTRVRLDWNAVDDPESTVIGYNLYRDGALIGENFATTFSFDDYGILPDALYVYELKAVNGAWLESSGGTGIETVATAETVEGVGGLLEEVSTEVFTQVIEGILADPEIPDAIAADIQASLDDLIGQNGGLAANGAADKLEKSNIVAALSMMRHAVEELQTAGAQGYDTTDLQELVTSFARLSVLTVIRIEAETLGDGHPDIVAARDLVDQGDGLLEVGDYLGAIDLYKDAVQALP